MSEERKCGAMLYVIDKLSNHHLIPRERIVSINTTANGRTKASNYGHHTAVLYNIVIRYQYNQGIESLNLKDYEYGELEKVMANIKRQLES